MIDIVKVLLPAIFSFIVGIAITPAITNYLYKNKMWKKKSGKVAIDGKEASVFNKLHRDKEVNTPRMGGSVIWISAYAVGSIIWLLSHTLPFDFLIKLEFISRDQTWIPFAALLIGALVGLIDDMMEIKGSVGRLSGGLSLSKRILVVAVIAVAVSTWFFLKLDVTSIALPAGYLINLGWLIIPALALIMVGIYAGGVIDGVDGLAGGVFASMFGAYGVIAYYQDQINLAAFCGLIVGGILAFLWFNIPPARFYMSETGSMALTITLVIIAFMTDTIGGGIGIFVLPIIAFPLVITTITTIIQLTYKKYTGGKKIFHSTPIHHHFEALGWPNYKVTMRYWIVSVLCSATGVIIALIF